MSCKVSYSATTGASLLERVWQRQPRGNSRNVPLFHLIRIWAGPHLWPDCLWQLEPFWWKYQGLGVFITIIIGTFSTFIHPNNFSVSQIRFYLKKCTEASENFNIIAIENWTLPLDAEGISFGALRFYRIKLFLFFVNLVKLCHPIFWLSLNSSLE